jgi:hypothetical protein
MAQEKKNVDHVTGRDLPDGDGGVGDEQVHRITDRGEGKPIGQDHSTERHETMDPEGGVGVFQQNWDTRSDIAHIEGEEGEESNDNYETRRPRPLNL